ncbi:Cell wall hydrolase CwlJ [compost metagenome]
MKSVKGGSRVAVIKTNSEDVKLLARLMQAGAEEDLEPGMLMVGNVGVNRILSDCLDFKNIRTMKQMVFQSQVAMNRPRRVISIRKPETGKFDWQVEPLMESEPGLRTIRCGSSARRRLSGYLVQSG